MNAQDQKWIVLLVDRLALQFPEHTRDDVAAAVDDCHCEFAGSRIRDFVPILVERKARERLKGTPTAAPATTIPVQRHVASVEAPVSQVVTT